MATTKVSELSALTTTDGAEELLINDGGTSKKVTIANLLHDNSIDSDHYVDGSIDTAHLAADAITGAKIADDAIDSEHYVDASIDNAHLADDAVGIAELSATGTASSSTFLRGDNSWVTPTDTNTTYSAGTGITLAGTTFSAAPVALTTVQTAANQVAHLALTAEEGDVVVRSDESKTYMHNGGSAGSMLDYTLMATPTDSVTSVVGQTGVVSTAQIKTALENGIDSVHYVDGSIDLVHMSSESVDEDNIHISNAGSNGQFLSKQSGDAGGLTWATPTDTNTMGSGFTVSATTDSNATTITQGDDLMFTAGTGITCETTADGTVTITNTVSGASTATSSATGVIKLEDDTDQSVAANTVSTTAGRTYGLQLNSSDQGVVNVPWTDTNTTYTVGDGGLTQINFTTADNTKLDAIEAGADVTDATNVTAAGALMDSEVTNLAAVKAFATSDYATAAQGTTADAALPKAGGAMTGAITTNSTFDGVDIATRDAVLTSTTTTANAALPKAGGTLTGTVTVSANAVGTVTTDNDGSFAMSATNNFKCTPAGNFALTFTSIVAQSGNILLVNSGGHTVSAHANTKVDANLLATVSAAGTYLLSYFSDGTNVYMTNSAIYT
jgi:hypothetical protein